MGPGSDVNEPTVLGVLSLLSKKWHPRILLTLYDAGPLGYNELLERLDISGKVLTENLDGLLERELLTRTVLNESPLRVEYELTAAGTDLVDALDGLAAWGERHLEESRPCVVVADRDRRLTELYERWLSPTYLVRRAHDYDELNRAVDESVDVVVFDQQLPSSTDGAILELIRLVDDDTRTIALIAERPPLEASHGSDCDAYVLKPTTNETLCETVETQLERYGESAQSRERHALEERRTTLESTYPSAVLGDHDAYDALCARLEQLRTDGGV